MTIDVAEQLAAFRPYDIDGQGCRGYALDALVKRWFGTDSRPAYPPDDPHWKAVDMILDLEGWGDRDAEHGLTELSAAIAEFFVVLDVVASDLSEHRGDRHWLRLRGPAQVRTLGEAHTKLGEVLDAWATKAAKPPAPDGAVTAGELIAKLATVSPDTPVEFCDDIEDLDPEGAAIWPVKTVRYDDAAEAVTLGY